MSRDVIGDFLTIMRNGIMRSKPSVDIPFSRLKQDVALLLQNEGFVRDVITVEELPHKTLRVILKYVNGESVIHELKRVSTPGSRVYRGVKQLGIISGGFGVAVVSTNRGVITNKQARELSVGGEILCTVW